MADELAPPDPTSLEISQDDKTMAMLAHLAAIPTGFLGPLIIYAVKANESPYVAYHALQASIFTGAFIFAFIVAYVVIAIISFVTCGVGALLYLVLLPFALLAPAGNIYLALQAHKGEWVGYPLMDHFGRP